MIRRMLSILAAIVTAAVVAPAVPASAAFGSETYGCRLSPGTILTWEAVCVNSRPAARYNAGFALLNTSGAYQFSWTISGPYESIFTGCDSTSSGCGVWVPGGSTDSTVTVSVTYTQDGQTATRSATAIVRGYCGKELC